MIWKKCVLIANEPKSAELADSNNAAVLDCRGAAVLVNAFDRLGNVVCYPKDKKTVFARFTPSDESKAQLDGRTVTADTRRLLLRCTARNVPKCDFVRFEGKNYRVEEKIDLRRFVLLIVRNANGV